MAFPTTSVLDNANRADEGPPPSASWGNLVAGLVVSSNQFAPSGPGNRSSYWLTAFNANCEVFATIGTEPASNRTQTLFVRLHDVGAGTTDGYGVRLNKLAGTDTLEVVIMTNGSLTAIGAAVSQELVSGNKFGLEANGSTFTVYIDTGSGWTSLFSRTDSTYSVGGFVGADVSSGTIDDFGGGNLAAGGAISGTAAGSSTASGTLVGDGALAGAAAGSTAATGTLTNATAGAISGTAAGAAALTGTLTGTGALSGAAAGAAGENAVLTGVGALAGQSDGVGAVSGALAGAGALVGAAAGSVTVAGLLLGVGSLAGSAAGATTATANLVDANAEIGNPTAAAVVVEWATAVTTVTDYYTAAVSVADWYGADLEVINT